MRRHLDGVRSFTEVGCGSGFLTKYPLVHAHDPRRAFASDINLAAIRCAADTQAEIAHRASVSLVCPQADDPGFSITGPFDLVTCNPPYILRPGVHNNNAYEGLGLIARFAQRGEQLLADDGFLLLDISTLAGDGPLAWFDEHAWQLDVLDRMRVPPKVNALTSDGSPRRVPGTTASAPPARSPPKESGGYPLWHELRRYACRPRR
jgi:methylase of polypeptide subunit release factors